jgi:nucleoside-diphosphate-sugar epimerase
MTDHGTTARDGWHLLGLGLGYTAAALARRLAPTGARISGTARTPEGVEQIRARGWEGFAFAGAEIEPGLAEAIGTTTHVLLSAAPDAAGDPVLRHLGGALAGAPRLRWIGYLSTVSVYGDYGGAWIDEATPPRDPGPAGEMRLAAETAWQAFGARHGVRVDVFRLPGIYGPGRGAVRQLRTGTARRVAKPGHVFNRIHVDDIAAALEAAMAVPSAGTVYNLTDDEPAPADEVVAYAARALGLEPPPLVAFDAAPFSPMARSFYDQCKRVSNRRMKENLGVKLAYPTYREGMAALAAIPDDPDA